MNTFIFTSESVGAGHPDKIADQISDAIVDACIAADPHSRVGCETMVTNGLVILSGEIDVHVPIDYQEIVRRTIKEIGYNDPRMGLDYRACGVLTTFNKQSPNIATGIDENQNAYQRQGAGDQGVMFGFACEETPQLMPLPIMLAHGILRELRLSRENGSLNYLRPDAKSQVTVEYDRELRPLRIGNVVLSTQHEEEVDPGILEQDMRQLVRRVVPCGLIDERTIFYVNPIGRFVLGGPAVDCGLTGRKIIVDTYGGMGRSGGGAFSGKDPTKIDRSASYMARYIAKNIVAARLATRCEVQLAYAIGVPYPVSVQVNTFGTSLVDQELLSQVVPEIFDLTPKGMIETLKLRRPIYRQTAYEGHFGREETDFTWEKRDKTLELLNAIKALS
jgi:S-adenosylmethionine synthetase